MADERVVTVREREHEAERLRMWALRQFSRAGRCPKDSNGRRKQITKARDAVLLRSALLGEIEPKAIGGRRDASGKLLFTGHRSLDRAIELINEPWA